MKSIAFLIHPAWPLFMEEETRFSRMRRQLRKSVPYDLVMTQRFVQSEAVRVPLWACVPMLPEAWTAYGYPPFRDVEQVGPQTWQKTRMERDLEAMWWDEDSAYPRCLSGKRESSGSMWPGWSVHWQGSHVEGHCYYFVCLQRAETGPLGESCKEAGVWRLGIDLELLIKGCLGKKPFPLPGGVRAGLGA